MSQSMTDDKTVAPEGQAPEPAVATPAPASEAAVAAVPEASTAPVAPAVTRQRQWVTLRNGSMDTRSGWGIHRQMAHDLRSALGKPHACLLVFEPGADPELKEFLYKDFMAEGFKTTVAELADGGCDLPRVAAFDGLLANAGVTADDLVVAVGHEVTLAVASFACASWCGGVSLAHVPMDLVSAVCAGTTPRALDLEGRPRTICQEGSVRFSILDAELLCGAGQTSPDLAAEDTLHAFALMVATAMDDSDKAFGRLWDNVDAIMAGDVSVFMKQLVDCVKSRGKVASSSAISTRQSIEYGQSFADALAALVGDKVPASVRLADGMRFAARLAVAQETFTIDDMLAQDELLERLGLGTTEEAVDADALVEALKAERFSRTRRFMLACPRALGRVRLATVDDALLREHVGAWCAAR